VGVCCNFRAALLVAGSSRVTGHRHSFSHQVIPVNAVWRESQAEARRAPLQLQTFCRYGAPSITGPELHGMALRYS
jgi:hypothetical protein